MGEGNSCRGPRCCTVEVHSLNQLWIRAVWSCAHCLTSLSSVSSSVKWRWQHSPSEILWESNEGTYVQVAQGQTSQHKKYYFPVSSFFPGLSEELHLAQSPRVRWMRPAHLPDSQTRPRKPLPPSLAGAEEELTLVSTRTQVKVKAACSVSWGAGSFGHTGTCCKDLNKSVWIVSQKTPMAKMKIT